jgi:hypothetical protein
VLRLRLGSAVLDGSIGRCLNAALAPASRTTGWRGPSREKR